MAHDKFITGAPTRQGFYRVRLDNGEKRIAEWREYDKKTGKRWWTYTSADPTVDKTRVPLVGPKGAPVVGYAKIDESEVERFLQRERTREEKIEDSVAQLRKNQEMYPEFKVDIPPNRLLKIGQDVIMGHHTDVKVAALHDEGQIVTIESHRIETKHGQTVDHGISFSSHLWLNVIPKVAPVAKGLARSAVFSTQTHFNTPVHILVRRMYSEGVSDNPEYQRKYEWTLDDKNRFLESVFAGRHLGSFLFVKESPPHADVLFDGKQRMHTLLELISSVLPYKGVYWHEMDPSDRQTALNRSVQFAELDSKIYSRADLLEIFLEVNAAGVPQTEEHLAHVRGLLAAERAKEAAAKS